MVRTHLALGAAFAALLSQSLHAQAKSRECPGGPADRTGYAINTAVAAHPTRAAEIVDSALVQAGYAIQYTPPGEGEWRVAPRFTNVEGLREGAMEGVEHPGVRLGIQVSAGGDSTRVLVSAHTLCATLRNGVRDDDAATAIELVHAVMLSSAITERADSLAAAGVDLHAALERDPGVELNAPAEVAGWRRIGRHDYDDPAAGINLRYGRDDGRYVDVYVYPGAPSECDAVCGARHVNEEADGFIGDLPELVRRGYYGRMDVREDETLPVPAGAPWLHGRHLTLDVELRGARQESQYYLFAFPGYKVKVRATFPPSEEMTSAVESFVEALLPALVNGAGPNSPVPTPS